MPIFCGICGIGLGNLTIHYSGKPFHSDFFCHECYGIPGEVIIDEDFAKKYPAVDWDKELQNYMNLLKNKNEGGNNQRD